MNTQQDALERLPASAGSEMWLFPAIAAEIKEDRQAAAREAAQRVRQEKRQAVKHLKTRDLTWLIDRLVDGGPATEHMLTIAAMESKGPREGLLTLADLWALWRVGKCWRKSQGIHFGSGEESFVYGLRGVHSQNSDYPEQLSI